jgi:hypothetical protein
VQDLVREVRPPFSPESAVGEFCETLAMYKIKRVQGDRYAGQWPREQFAKRGVRYDPADKTASQLFLELVPAINAGTCRLLDHRRTIDQLINLERRTSFGTGRDTVGHPPGCHDDLAVAVAGAVVLATAKKQQIVIGCQDGSALVPDPDRKGAWIRTWPNREQPTNIRVIHVDENGNELTADEAAAIRHRQVARRAEA